MMMGLPGKLLFMVSAVFTVNDSKAECKQETKEKKNSLRLPAEDAMDKVGKSSLWKRSK